jgi:hypothetical protein
MRNTLSHVCRTQAQGLITEAYKRVGAAIADGSLNEILFAVSNPTICRTMQDVPLVRKGWWENLNERPVPVGSVCDLPRLRLAADA